jgi:predicted secreted protein
MMKRKILILMIASLISVFFITACTPTSTVNTPDENIAAEVDDEDARMEALISEKIESCHMLSFVLSKNKTAEEWSTTIDRMIGKGAKINPEEKEIIINWLVSRNE